MWGCSRFLCGSKFSGLARARVNCYSITFHSEMSLFFFLMCRHTHVHTHTDLQKIFLDQLCKKFSKVKSPLPYSRSQPCTASAKCIKQTYHPPNYASQAPRGRWTFHHLSCGVCTHNLEVYRPQNGSRLQCHYRRA